MSRRDRNIIAESIKINGLDDEMISRHVPAHLLVKLKEEVEFARELLPRFEKKAFLEGTLTPIWFGSALNSFGVQELMNGIAQHGPEPLLRNASPRTVNALEKSVSGFVFKVQANMDPKHRDRVAFLRVCAGHFRRGMKLTHVLSLIHI